MSWCRSERRRELTVKQKKKQVRNWIDEMRLEELYTLQLIRARSISEIESAIGAAVSQPSKFLSSAGSFEVTV